MLTIGSRRFESRAVQAALSGYSDRPMRLIARRYGAELTMNEVVLDRLVLQKGKLRDEILSLGADDHPTGGQLMGSEPEQFAAAAHELVEAGYDLVDINFGCPVRKVLGRCRGGYLLTEPKKALEIVRGVVGSVAGRRPVLLKMRRGFDDTAESERNFFTILDGALSSGVAAITVHGRTVEQRYVGPARWSFLSRVKRHVGDRTVLGSGDLFTAEAVKRMIEETGVDGVMVARGAIGNPFIFRECRALLSGAPLPPPPGVAEQREAIERHLALAESVYGASRAAILLRKFWIRYSQLHPCAEEVRQAFLDAKNSVDCAGAIARWYDPNREWPPVVRRDVPADLIASGSSLES